MNISEYNNLTTTFYKYVDGFRDSDGCLCKLLDNKLEHIKRVASNALFIAKNENWSDKDCLIAEICGLYHDIGRFSQYKKFKTFADSKSVNHGTEGYNSIISNHLFDSLDEKSAETILDAVKYHNSLNVPTDLPQDSIRFTNITRDSDKIDIFYMLTESIKNNCLKENSDLLWNLPIGKPNPVIVEKLMSNSQALYSDIKSGTDVCLLQLCWIYGMNYKSSLAKLKENRTVELIATILPNIDEIRKCLNHIQQYLQF